MFQDRSEVGLGFRQTQLPRRMRSNRMPSPGLTRLTAANPRKSAARRDDFKVHNSFHPIRPIVRTLPVLAMPATSVPNSSGARIDFIKRRNAVLTGASFTANLAQKRQGDTGGHPEKIQDVNDNRFIARPSSISP